jgi:CheY-like chemotaxis protein
MIGGLSKKATLDNRIPRLLFHVFNVKAVGGTLGLILVIDDDEGILEVVHEFLSQHGYHVKIAHNGEEGIALFDRGQRFDLVITDIRMPGIDGNAVAKYIKHSDRADTPIMAISGFTDNINKGLFNMYIQKPFDLNAIIDAARSLV